MVSLEVVVDAEALIVLFECLELLQERKVFARVLRDPVGRASVGNVGE